MANENRIIVKCGKTELKFESMTNSSVYWYEKVNELVKILSATSDAEVNRVSKSWSEDE